jgi:REP element-mobilizing transposase RayT
MISKDKSFYRRRLPHYQPPGATFFVTYRLAGSLPMEVLLQLKEEQRILERSTARTEDQQQLDKLLKQEKDRYFSRFDEFLENATTGPRWLNEPRIATLVTEAIHYRDNKDYELLSCCIMPNHLHMLVAVDRSDASLYRILQSLKAYTALEGNRILARSGAFWQHESYDHVVRDGAELERIVYYILNNPVKAGLCKHWRDWKWTYVKEGLIET